MSMNDARGPRRIGRSILAVLAGLVAGVVLSLGSDVILHAIHVFPAWGDPVDNGPLALATAYRAVYSVLAGYIAARLAPDRPVGHALVLGFVGLVISLIGAAATWNLGPAFEPHWYPVALVVLAIPCPWLGGKLFERNTTPRASGTG
jgi:predicted acyltransferase